MDLAKFRGVREQAREDAARVWREVSPTIHPSVLLFHLVEYGEDGARWSHIFSGCSVIVSAHTEADGKRWLHVSVGHPARLPRWEELREVKDNFIGKDRLAIQVLPAAKDYVNINPNVLHLWCCLDDFRLPDFTGGSGSL